jgi:hypothetical protein
MIFHTFWPTYGVMLENILACDHTPMDKIKGREGSIELLGFDENHSSKPKNDVGETTLLVISKNIYTSLC